MRCNVSELEGMLLDAAVAMVEGDALPDYWRDPEFGTCWLRPGREEWNPSNRWDQGGPIIERERISLHIYADGSRATIAIPGRAWRGSGPTPLIAAMRAFVASKFGEEVELP